jgi:hypothetical protein
MLRKLLRYSLTALAILLAAVTTANAAQKHRSSEPHVNVGFKKSGPGELHRFSNSKHRHSMDGPKNRFMGRNDGGLQQQPPPTLDNLDSLIGGARIRF